MVLGTSLAFAGGMPSDAQKKASTMEQGVEVEEPAPEVKEEPMAQEDANRGFTVGIRGALSILNSDSISGVAIPPYGPLGATVDYDQGYSLSLMLGYALGNGLRLEAEAGYINNGFQEINVRTPGAFAAHLDTGKTKLEGDISVITILMNAYYDINLGGNLVPYIGGGFGGADLTSEMRSADGLLVDDSNDCVFIYQVGAGLGYKISGFGGGPDITVSLDYRYLASFEDPRFRENASGKSRFIEGEFGGHYIGGGIRLRL